MKRNYESQILAIRSECRQILDKKTQEVESHIQTNKRLTENLQAMSCENKTILEENKILKKAVAIQDNRCPVHIIIFSLPNPHGICLSLVFHHVGTGTWSVKTTTCSQFWARRWRGYITYKTQTRICLNTSISWKAVFCMAITASLLRPRMFSNSPTLPNPIHSTVCPSINPSIQLPINISPPPPNH